MKNTRRRSIPLPLSRPYINHNDVLAVSEVMQSGWLTTGPITEKFEDTFSRFFGTRSAVAVTSATAGMHLLLHTLGLGPGDEVITPSLTWVSTVNLIEVTGATPVFVDIDQHTLMADHTAVEAAISERTRAIIPVHFAGAPLDLPSWHKLGKKFGIPVIEDAAHALGSECRGIKVGQEGTAIYSFHPLKNITTGEGGMIVSRDEALIKRLRRLRFHGLAQDSYTRESQGRRPQAEVIEPGFKYNMTDMAAALGLSQLSRLKEINQLRSELAQLYMDRLNTIEEILPLALPTYDHLHTWHLFVVRINTRKSPFSRNELMAKLTSLGIGTGIHFKAVHTQEYYRRVYPHWVGKLPSTEWNSERLLSLPLFPGMSTDDVDDVIWALKYSLASIA